MKSPSHEKAANTRVVIVVVVILLMLMVLALRKRKITQLNNNNNHTTTQPLYNVDQNLPTNTCFTLFQYQVKTE
jgi:hypothetical protein